MCAVIYATDEAFGWFARRAIPEPSMTDTRRGRHCAICGRPGGTAITDTKQHIGYAHPGACARELRKRFAEFGINPADIAPGPDAGSAPTGTPKGTDE